MKKYLVLFSFFVVTFSYSQYFKLTENGLINQIDSTQHYVVLEFPNKTQQELYKSMLVWANKNYISGKDVISSVENENITINAIQSPSIKYYKNGAGIYDMSYRINISFKDERIKINTPIFELYNMDGSPNEFNNYSKKRILSIKCKKGTGFSRLMTGDECIFDKNGRLKSRTALEGVNLQINALIAEIKLSLEGNNINNKNDNW